MDKDWYKVENEAQLDSPSLLVYKARVQRNIELMIEMAGSAESLMVHVKTNKMPAVVQMLLRSGISRFKCATIAEAEMVCQAGGGYLVLAHQLVGPKIQRLIALRKAFPQVYMASLIDCREAAQAHQQAFEAAGLVADVLLDVNNGMDRSGHPLNEKLLPLYQRLQQYPNLRCHGLHVYDGQWRNTDFKERKERIDADFKAIDELVAAIKKTGLPAPMLVAGGTPSFTSHLLRTETYCSPGTCVFWDWGYKEKLSEQNFDFAALVLTRIISKPAEGIITVDMGHKAIAAENELDKRIRFLNLSDYELSGQSEEHGVLKVKNWEALSVGDVLYGVPYHICPTVNLYDEAYVVERGRVEATWEIPARRRKITI